MAPLSCTVGLLLLASCGESGPTEGSECSAEDGARSATEAGFGILACDEYSELYSCEDAVWVPIDRPSRTTTTPADTGRPDPVHWWCECVWNGYDTPARVACHGLQAL